MLAQRIPEIQSALAEAGLEGWFFSCFQQNDPIGLDLLGLSGEGKLVTRRCYYLVPREGEPRKLVHALEPAMLDHLPGSKAIYLRWQEHRQRFGELVSGFGRLAAQYSPNNELPTVSRLDAGTADLLKAAGVELDSSADLAQRFAATWSQEQLEGHRRANVHLHRIALEAFNRVSHALRRGDEIDEYAVQRFILDAFEQAGLWAEADPIVGVNAHIVRAGLLALGLAAGTAMAQTAICYNCPTEWADWGTQLRAIKAKTGVTVPPDNKNSGQSLAQLVAEKASPVADVTYLGVTFGDPGAEGRRRRGLQARRTGTTSPTASRTRQASWFTIHSGTLGFMVNVDALRGKPVPKSWADLLKPEYKGLIGYLDPASRLRRLRGRGRGQPGARRHARQLRRRPWSYFKALQKNEPIVPKQTSYARVLSGEIAILLDYDFNAYRAKYKDKANVAFVIPSRRHGGRALRDEPGRQGAARRRTARRCSTSCSPTRARRSGPTPTCARCAPARCPRRSRRSSCLPPSTRAPRPSTTAAWPRRRRPSPSAT